MPQRPRQRFQDSAAYGCWRNMLSRCYNPNATGYKHYGGKGVTVCDRWRGPDGFVNFLADMGERPTKNHSIDRKRRAGNYEPDNCRWATSVEQARDARGPSPRTLEIASVIASGASIADVTSRYGISEQRARQIRLKYAGVNGLAGRPPSNAYTVYSRVGREALTRLVRISEDTGTDVAALLEWLAANAPK